LCLNLLYYPEITHLNLEINYHNIEMISFSEDNLCLAGVNGNIGDKFCIFV
jgi:hypothetical protein